MIEGGEVKDKTLHGAATAAGGGGAGVQSWKGCNCDCWGRGTGRGGVFQSWKGWNCDGWGEGVQSWKGWNCDCGVGVGGHGQGLVRSWKGSRGPSGKRTGWVLQLRGKG